MKKKVIVMKKYRRLQGKNWHLVKNSFRLLYTYKSDNGNIKGIYTDGKTKISHWLNDEEKFEQLQQENQQLQEELECTIGIVEHNRIISEKNKEIHQLKDNWNDLKKYAKEIISTDNELYGTDLLDKMQELEQGSDSNE